MSTTKKRGDDAAARQNITTTLLVRTAKLDQRAMTDLMSRIRPRIVNMVRALVKDQGETIDDYVAECVLSVVRGFDGFSLRPGASFNGWLSVIVRNKIVDLFRRRGQQPVPLGEPDSENPVMVVSASDPSPSTIAMRREGDQLVAQLLQPGAEASSAKGDGPLEQLVEQVQRLPPHQRAVLVRRVLLDASFKEIATELGISEANARMRYMFARRTLLARLSAGGDAPRAGG